jgi:2-keto-4-pentenoate hydratase/2-oxohepta-3-ene-1,7-dioic acid hydratase in catechol pathway
MGDPRALSSVRWLLTKHADDLGRLHEATAELAGATAGIARAGVRLGPPVPDPEKILCVGLNYRAHASEARLDEPAVPLVFAKFPNTLIGDGAPIRLPAAHACHVDYEGEVAVVIGRRVYAADEQQALEAGAGWMAFNDVSARDLQTQTSQVDRRQVARHVRTVRALPRARRRAARRWPGTPDAGQRRDRPARAYRPDDLLRRASSRSCRAR